MKLVEDAHKCWRWLSVQANTLGIAISGTYGALYDQLKDNFPPKYLFAVTGLVFFFGIVGRLISQTKDEPK